MNSHQKLQRARLSRRFTRSDGVSYVDEQGLLRSGVVQSIQCFNENTNQWSYSVKDSDSLKCLLLDEKSLKSKPTLNSGKYGGPLRGGAAEKDVVASSYR